MGMKVRTQPPMVISRLLVLKIKLVVTLQVI